MRPEGQSGACLIAISNILSYSLNMSRQLNIAAHVLGMLAFLEREKRPITSEELGRSIGTHPVVVRRVLSRLRAAGLIESRGGAKGGTVLARDPRKISLRDAFEALNSDDFPILERHGEHVNRACNVGPVIADYLDRVFSDAEEELLACLDRVSIDEMSREIVDRVQRRATLKAPTV
jgi:Rrf2 family protein